MPSWRLLRALYAPDSYALVLLLILVTYALSTALTETWATSLIVAVQIGTVWVTLRAARARRTALLFANAALGVAALAAIASLAVNYQFHTDSVVAWVSCALYLAAPVAIVRHLLRRRTIDAETVLGAIAAYLMAGMFFAFLYRAVGIVQTHPPFFGPQGPGTFSQDLFFSFTTLTTTGYGDLTPAGNPGQSFAVLEMLIGQLFLITAVGKVVSSWRPGQGHGGLREKHDGESHRPSSPEPPAARPTLFRGIPRAEILALASRAPRLQSVAADRSGITRAGSVDARPAGYADNAIGDGSIAPETPIGGVNGVGHRCEVGSMGQAAVVFRARKSRRGGTPGKSPRVCRGGTAR